MVEWSMRLSVIFVSLFWSGVCWATPIAGDTPIKFGHLETSAQATVGGDRLSMLALGRIGLGNEVDTGLALGLGLGNKGGIVVGVPLRFFWLKANQLNGLARITSDGWVAMQDSGQTIRSILSKTFSITHRNELFKQSVEIRLSVGGSAVYEDRGDLDDELVLSPTALVGISGFEFHGFQCALEAGLAEDSGRVTLGAALEF